MNLLRKEWHDLWPRCAIALGLTILIFIFSDQRGFGLVGSIEYATARQGLVSITGKPFLTWILSVCVMAVWAGLLGYDALAGELADDTWRFLGTRPVSPLRRTVGKLGLRAALLLGPWLLYRGAVYGYLYWAADARYAALGLGTGMRADAVYMLESPPYIILVAEAVMVAHLVLVLGLAVSVGAGFQQRGLALGAQFIAAVAVLAFEIALVWRLVEAPLRVWQVPWLYVLSLTLCTVWVLRVTIRLVAKGRGPEPLAGADDIEAFGGEVARFPAD